MLLGDCIVKTKTSSVEGPPVACGRLKESLAGTERVILDFMME